MNSTPIEPPKPGKQTLLGVGLAVFIFSLITMILESYQFPSRANSFYFNLNPLGLHQFQTHLGLNRIPQRDYRSYSHLMRLIQCMLWGGYTLAIYACLRGARPSLRPLGLLVILAGAVTAIFSPPLFSTDAYANVAHGRIFVLYGHNPYLWKPIGLLALHDPIAPFLVWDMPSIYGPLWTWIEVGMVALTRSWGVWAQVITIKLLLAGALMGAAYSGRLLARKFSPGLENLTFLAIGLNPLMLLEGPGNGHNDIVFVVLLLIGAGCYFDKKYAAAALMLGLSVGIKPIMLAILPWVLLDYSRGRSLRQSLSGVAAATSLVLLPLVVLFLPFWAGLKTLASMQQRTGIFQRNAGIDHALLVLIYLGLTFWLWKWRSHNGWLTASALFSVAMMFLLLAPPFPWYIVWFAPIFLLRWGRWQLAFSIASLCLSFSFLQQYEMLTPNSQPVHHRWVSSDGKWFTRD